MIYPYADKLDAFGSRFGLVVLAAKRAKQLRSGASPMTATSSTNALTISLEEIALGKVNTRILESDEPVARIEEADFTSLFPLGSLGVIAGDGLSLNGVGEETVGDLDDDWDTGEDDSEDEVEEEIDSPIHLSSLESDDEIVEDQERELAGGEGLSEITLGEDTQDEDADWHEEKTGDANDEVS